MSLFDPMDVRGPDARRKQLMHKLAQQGRRAVPLPARAGNAAGGPGIGRMFSGAASARPQSVHPGNIVSSIAQRLGVGGGPQMGEYGGGVGSPIQGYGDPFSRAPQAISGGTPIAPNASWAGPAPDALPGGGFQPPVPGGGGISPGMAPNGSYSGVAPGVANPQQAVNFAAEGSAAVGNTSGLVPLGNGMYYDPASDQVVNHSAPNSGGGSLYSKSY